MSDNIGGAFVGLFGCLVAAIIALVMVVVGFLIHWPESYCYTAGALAIFAVGFLMGRVE